MDKVIRRGDIWVAELKESYKYLLKGEHPVVILSNWKACDKSPILNVIPITSQIKKGIPAHVLLSTECGLDRDSTALCEQLLPISKENLIYQVGKCTSEKMAELQNAINKQLGFTNNYNLDMFQKVKEMLDSLNELDRYLTKNFDAEVLKERELAVKCLERYCINHSIALDTSLYTFRIVRENDVKAI